MKLRSSRPFQASVLGTVVGLAVLVGFRFVFHTHAANQVSTTTTNNSANQIIDWASKDTLNYTDADLNTLKARGVVGISIGQSYLVNMGGSENWSPVPCSQVSGANHTMQQALCSNNLVARAHALGMKVFFVQGIRNYNNTSTPLCNWSDNACWTNTAIPGFANMAGAMKNLGIDGLWFDEESYNAAGWDISKEPDRATIGDAAVRTFAKQRGNQVMAAMLQQYTGLDLAVYGAYFPGGWNALVQQVVNNCAVPCYSTSLQQNWFDGLTSAEGYSHIRITDATFYKSTNLSGASWETSNQYNANQAMAYFSQTFSDWNYAASRISMGPFIWIDSDVTNEGNFTAPQSVSYVTAQLTAFRKWGMDSQLPMFDYADPIYGPWESQFTAVGGWPTYVPAMQAAAVVGTVDSSPPSLVITNPASGSASTTNTSFTITGNASDDQAIRYVSWSNDRGGSGMAPMTWQINSGSYTTSYNWQMNWSTGAIALQPGINNITIKAVDIHGNSTSQIVAITTPGGSKPGDINGDGVVGIADLSILAANYGKTGMTLAQGDLNGDGTVGIADLSILANYWGT